MAYLIYVTGVPGAGKSTLRSELRRRGVVAVGIDEDGLAAFHREDGTVVPPDEVVDSADWRRAHVWRVISDRLDAVAQRDDAEIIFVCGSAANEDEVWHFFAMVIGLIIDEATQRLRLAERTGNNFGKSESELELAIDWNRSFESDSATWGVVPVDGTQSVSAVADRVVTLAGALLSERRDRRD